MSLLACSMCVSLGPTIALALPSITICNTHAGNVVPSGMQNHRCAAVLMRTESLARHAICALSDARRSSAPPEAFVEGSLSASADISNCASAVAPPPRQPPILLFVGLLLLPLAKRAVAGCSKDLGRVLIRGRGQSRGGHCLVCFSACFLRS